MKRRGVYVVLHVPSGSAYVGSSTHVTNRFTWHRYMLRRGLHRSVNLQRLWNKSREKDWVFAVVQFCRSLELQSCEMQWITTWPGAVLNERDVEWNHSAETKRKISVGRARYLETPGARKALSEKAKKQHVEGRFRQGRPRGVYR